MYRAIGLPRTFARAFFTLIGVLLVLASSVGTARAQASKSVTITAGTTDPRAEEEAPDSPRASVRSFLDLAERGRYEDAAIYLDLPKGSEKRAGELASKLYTVLSQRLLVNAEQLSPLAHGHPTAGLPANVEELGKITDAKGHPVPIRLVRHESKGADDESRWLFAQSTVALVDMLYGSLRDRWIRDRLPAPLLSTGPMALYYWQWLAIPLLAALCLVVGRAISWSSGLLAKGVLAKRPWSTRLLAGLRRPTTLGWGLAAFALLIPSLSLTLRAEDLIERGLRALAYLTFFWGLVSTVSVAGDEIAHADWTRSRPTARSLSAVGVSLGKVVVAALALMVVLSELGYQVTSVVAGLGIGGVALALAAQKTVENLFGSISILGDQPFLVGDTIRVDTIEGTVESIGLRSTRVRTVERTLVIFPNGKLADMRIESLGPRDRMRFATKLQLSRMATMTMADVRAIIAAVQKSLTAHPSVRKEDVFVCLSAIGEASYDIEVSAQLDTIDQREFTTIREELLVSCIEIVEKAGARLAVPTRQLLEPWTKPPAVADKP